MGASWIEDPGSVEGYDLKALGMDQCYVSFQNFTKQLYLYTVLDECETCPFTLHAPLSEKPTVFSTSAAKWRIRDKSEPKVVYLNQTDALCEFSPDLGEFGVYQVNVNEKCSLETIHKPVNIYLSLLTVILIWTGVGALIMGAKFLRNRLKKNQENDEGNSKRRVVSIDTYRGFCVCLMILVNYGGGGYRFLEHATWDGLTVADLVFPWFLWLMGVCIPLSVNSTLSRPGAPTKTRLMLSILRRSIILFMLGLGLNGGSRLDTIRIFSVLQRFGVSYLVAAGIYVVFLPAKADEAKGRFRDLRLLWKPWLVVLSLVAVHIGISLGVAKPGCETGYLGPGGLHEEGVHDGCTGGIIGYIDESFLGTKHIYKGTGATIIYKGGPLDPEGPFGCLTSVFQVFLGVHTGTVMRLWREPKYRIAIWCTWAIIVGGIGGLWTLCIPINKSLWSVSFVLVTAGAANVFLAALYFLQDVKNLWTGKPFLFAGMNATLLYVGHSLAHTIFPFRWSVENMNTHFLHFLSSSWGVAMWILVAYWLFRIKFFLSI